MSLLVGTRGSGAFFPMVKSTTPKSESAGIRPTEIANAIRTPKLILWGSGVRAVRLVRFFIRQLVYTTTLDSVQAGDEPSAVFILPGVGVEPTKSFLYDILSVVRLPISPPRRSRFKFRPRWVGCKL